LTDYQHALGHVTRKWLGICYLRTVGWQLNHPYSILKVMHSLCQLQGHIQGEFMHFTCRHWRGGRIHALHMQPLTRRKSSSLHAAIDEEEEFIPPCRQLQTDNTYRVSLYPAPRLLRSYAKVRRLRCICG